MDREIKFRGWDNGKMFYGIERLYDGSGNITDREGNEVDIYDAGATQNFGEWLKSGCPVMQFTGLKDKNGKEIYEGDILRIHNYKQTWKREEPPIDWRVFEVQWNRYTFYLNNEYIGAPLADYDVNDLEPWDIEVIGNIYENPELIK